MESLLSNPSVKIPFLVANFICGRICSSSPNPPPKPDELNKYGHDAKTSDKIKDWATWYTPLRRVSALFTPPTLILNDSPHSER